MFKKFMWLMTISFCVFMSSCNSSPLEKIMGDSDDWIAIDTYENEWPVYVNKNLEHISNEIDAEVLFDMSLERTRSTGSRFKDDEEARAYIKREAGLRQTPYYCLQKRRHSYWNTYIQEYCKYYDKDGNLIKEETGGVYDVLSDYEEAIRDKIKELAEPLLNSNS